LGAKGDKSKVKKRKIKNVNSSIKIGDKNNIEGAVIGQNIKNVNIIKNTPDNSVNYEGDKEDVTFLKNISQYLIGRFGKKKIGFGGAISLIFGVIGILTGFNSTVPNVKMYPYLPSISNPYANSLLILSFVFLALGAILFSAIQYHASSQCKECNKEYAYEEVGTPTVKEIKTSEGIRKITTRTYKCKFCGDEDVRKDSDLIETED
jgi:hypothetical protein